MTVDTFGQAVTTYGLPLVALVIVGLAFVKEWVVPGAAAKRDREGWASERERMDRAIAAVDRLSDLLERR